jgi:hypothetical protein
MRVEKGGENRRKRHWRIDHPPSVPDGLGVVIRRRPCGFIGHGSTSKCACHRALRCGHPLEPMIDEARWRNPLNALWRRCAGGGNINRDIPEPIRAARFALGYSRPALSSRAGAA